MVHSIERLESDRLLKLVLRDDFGTFIAKVFQTVAPGDTYLRNWHIDALAHALMQIERGACQRLVIAQPPRSLKTICASVAYVAWSLGHNPSKRFACVSYSLEIGATFARLFRAVVASDWYRALFPGTRFVKDTETECVTDLEGGRFVVPVGGSFTGRGADVIIIDDPIKADDARSEAMRRQVNEWYATTLLSRLDDKRKGAILLIMQRLHEDDLAGTVLREGGWTLLELQAIAEDAQEILIGPGIVHRRKRGDVLHPDREPLEVLEEQKRKMGALNFSAQYQQRPVPDKGHLVRRDWLKTYDIAPPREPGVQVVQSWDLASTVSDTGDWSVCTTWSRVRGTYYLIDVWRGRLEFPELRRKLIELAHRHRPNVILLEQAGPGLHLLQEMRANRSPGVPMPIGIKPEGDKRMRMEAQCARFEAGQVLLPKEAPWLGTFLSELLGFPLSRHDDQVDSVSQFLNWAERLRLDRRHTVFCAPSVYVDGVKVPGSGLVFGE